MCMTREAKEGISGCVCNRNYRIVIIRQTRTSLDVDTKAKHVLLPGVARVIAVGVEPFHHAARVNGGSPSFTHPRCTHEIRDAKKSEEACQHVAGDVYEVC